LKRLAEIEKDVKRLEDITDRFSKIGSAARLVEQNLVEVLYESVAYLEPRISKKVRFSINLDRGSGDIVP
jgi:hypothetical protein